MKHILRTALIAAALGFAVLGGASSTFAADGSGSINVALTQPRVVSGSVNTTVTCSTAGTVYSVRAHRASIHGTWIAGRMIIHGYTGPGAYQATVSVSFGRGWFVESRVVHNVQVTVSPTGGTWTFARTASGAWFPRLAGKTFAGTITYVCG